MEIHVAKQGNYGVKMRIPPAGCSYGKQDPNINIRVRIGLGLAEELCLSGKSKPSTGKSSNIISSMDKRIEGCEIDV
ncbi:hypothetical protein VNO77_09815 [Canavalia gladiata]|uniref:Uncharacterized protein n=1 Tax=Canavalia gladiata TaxID=3824 RepID=A0AAN9MG96_CANGL